jgi:hypothetical protein
MPGMRYTAGGKWLLQKAPMAFKVGLITRGINRNEGQGTSKMAETTDVLFVKKVISAIQPFTRT